MRDWIICAVACAYAGMIPTILQASDSQSAESTIRALVQANAEKDMATLSRLMAHDADITSYTLGGRKYVGWPDLERDMQEEFDSADTI
ncbi:MAG TPA: hypothetical protein VH681_06200, partial [Nitrospiraceae bacterium]